MYEESYRLHLHHMFNNLLSQNATRPFLIIYSVLPLSNYFLHICKTIVNTASSVKITLGLWYAKTRSPARMLIRIPGFGCNTLTTSLTKQACVSTFVSGISISVPLIIIICTECFCRSVYYIRSPTIRIYRPIIWHKKCVLAFLFFLVHYF